MKAEVKVLKDTLSSKLEKLKTLQAKYDNAKGLKGAKAELAKGKDRVVELKKNAASLKTVAKEEFTQLAEFEKHLSQAMDAVVGNMMYTMFLKHLNFDYSCLRDVVLELVAGYKQIARKGEITLEAPLHNEIPSNPLGMKVVTNSEVAAVLTLDLSSSDYF